MRTIATYISDDGKVFDSKGYTYKECKEAVDNTIADHIDEIFNNGDLNLSGETFDFTNLLFLS